MADPFLVVGAMKSGTTTLHELLARHPDVDLVVDKESNALVGPGQAPFVDAVLGSPRRVAGEVTAGYMQAPLMAQPVAAARELGASLKVVAVLREPFARAVSHWEQWTQLGREDRRLEDALADPGSAYVSFSSYAGQLRPWLELVGPERCLVLRLEDYEADPVGVAGRLWDFLGVPALPADQCVLHANRGDRRVVATGWRAGVRRSPVYRRCLRPLLSSSVRRRLAALAGGGRRRVTAAPDADLRPSFLALVDADLASLRRQWPDATW